MRQVLLYNTATRKIEPVQPISEPNLGLYACGPTVYDTAHIGHSRKYTMDDVLVRTLRQAGYTVQHVINVTDVGHLVSDDDAGEDKLEKGARKHNTTAWEVAKRFEKEFWEMFAEMNIAQPDVICRATDHIPEQIQLIQSLEDKGFTYITEDGVYFDTSKLADYGALAKLQVEGLQAGARVDVAGKKSVTDFALWKFSPQGTTRDMEWDSPWGKGFPGWHIECSAMSMKYLGEQFEIHTGGIDHIPVHHPNEIAQSEAATGKKPFVRHWVHHNHIQVDGTKMSKSLGNVYSIDDVKQKGFDLMALRLLYLGTHYRGEMNFTWDSLKGTQVAYTRLLGLLRGFLKEEDRTVLSEEKLQKVDEYREKFLKAILRDLNTPEALAVLWEVTKSNIPGQDKHDLICEFDTYLGLNLAEKSKEDTQTNQDIEQQTIPEAVSQLVTERQAHKTAGAYDKADAVRAQIEQLGWQVIDGAGGVTQLKKI